ncbi:hypothetical protein ACSAZK_13720 [Methanosarcina sp. Mfa9]|uniref:hypothetical protein n=1 Tax=Methanosarcina sp. Mfa9 TaxID=3439063 RepID=UPI003F85BBA2
MRKILEDESAWADFLISKAALILASVILFAALFQLGAGFRDFEAGEELDAAARDFKAAVDEVGAGSFQGESSEFLYHFEEFGRFQVSPFERGVEAYVSGEYFRLETEIDGKTVRAVKPFAFRVLPFNETELRGKLLDRFGAEGSREDPLPSDYSEITKYLSAVGAGEKELDVAKAVSIKKEFIYVKEGEEVSGFVCILIYQ